jgi:putative membrane protein
MRITIVALASFAASTALAQGTTGGYGTSPQPSPPTATQPAQPAPSASSTDQSFIKDAAAANQAEIKIGQLAVQKGTSDEVRKMGQTFVDDHRKLNERLQGIATRQGMTLPSQPTPDQKAAYDRLSALSGSDFDNAFMDQLKQDHDKAISLYQNEAQTGTAPQLKSFAQSTLPSLRQHQQMVSRPMKRM